MTASATALVGVRIGFVPTLPERVSLAVFSESHSDEPDQSRGLFVPFEGLHRIISASFRERGVAGLEHRDLGMGRLLDLFSRVEVDGGGNPVLTWVHAEGLVVGGRPPAKDPKILTTLHVTERWANGVLGLVKRGIVRVLVEPVPMIDDPGKTEMSWLPFGYDQKGDRFSIMSHTDSVFVAVPAPL